ncbi:unnamed protein product, partial [Staurois parvus]
GCVEIIRYEFLINISFVSKGGKGLRCEWSLTYLLFPRVREV